ncbi:MAG: hypothetical protein D6818_03435 [Bacteroidetes bacterium]|nr:MAG: hypothetical protein D6818_03435 [Bacteroidota bacterium]
MDDRRWTIDNGRWTMEITSLRITHHASRVTRHVSRFYKKLRSGCVVLRLKAAVGERLGTFPNHFVTRPSCGPQLPNRIFAFRQNQPEAHE